MNSRYARRSGRQIPEWMIFSVVLSTSSIFGLPTRLFLLREYPQLNILLVIFLTLIAGLLVLLALWLFIAATTWLVRRIWQRWAREN